MANFSKRNWIAALSILFVGALVFAVASKNLPLGFLSFSIGYEEKHLVVGFSGLTTTEKLPHLVGHFKYFSKGEEIVQEIDIEGGKAWNFSGEYISEVKVQNIAGEGYFQLFVSEGGESLLATDAIEDDRVVVYEK
jgi:hypothetical protein